MSVRLMLGDRRVHAAALLLVLALSAAATIGAMRRTSTTFDEIVMIAAGARGFHKAEFNLAPEHPPLTQYLYGLPVYLSRPNYPNDGRGVEQMAYRYAYAQAFFWRVGNDPERLAFLGRLAAALCALLLVGVTYAFTARAAGRAAALMAATLVAFLPDVLAHGGVAYNDIPLALLFVAAVWAVDEAVRRPELWRGALAGTLCALALGVKFSAIALLPIAALLVLAEAVVRGGERAWTRRLALAALAACIGGYLVLVLTYRGDLTLEELRYGLGYTFRHVSRGHGAPGYLLGNVSETGWWYFYPVAFLLKTPVALHALVICALAGAWLARPADWRAALASRLRAPALGALAFAASLVASNLVIGFRYALPALPLLCMLVAAGAHALWPRGSRAVRLAIAALVVWYAASSLSVYPHFLAFTSEYLGSRDRGHEALLDSSLDWGQGLLELREFMKEAGAQRVYLSYFGSALPEGYGIEYEPLPSFFPLRRRPARGDDGTPQYAVISATNLHGVYLPGDPFARLRENVQPERILGHTLFVYRLQ